ncbi:SRPBCC domain-containing protein [Allokutzneria sp. NRRL B-24872]|uniref:SRPBCC family protein n=1 Tax=Allokutzneria sp. NRRL B-24872 TaxID=1137961 RepID=UPI000A35F3E4|nr:SRPBCC domain-containing protein [Allokutzneria sp. NRRL B-24872]
MGREYEIVKEVALPVSPDAVWAAVATANGLAGWFMPMDISSGEAEVWDPPKHLVIKNPAGEDGSFHRFEYVIDGEDGRSSLRYVHSGRTGDGWPENYEVITSFGWDFYLHSLEEYLAHFAGRTAVYVEAEGPAVSAERAAWDRFVAAQGVSAVGDKISVSLPGLPAMDGVVDLINENFLCFRTADALVRFHGRMPQNMPVAISHHAFTPVDADACAEAWKTWLGTQFEGS